MKVFTADELIAAIKAATSSSLDGGKAKVCLCDPEGNMGPIEKLHLKYDNEANAVVIEFAPFEKA